MKKKICLSSLMLMLAMMMLIIAACGNQADDGNAEANSGYDNRGSKSSFYAYIRDFDWQNGEITLDKIDHLSFNDDRVSTLNASNNCDYILGYYMYNSNEDEELYYVSADCDIALYSSTRTINSDGVAVGVSGNSGGVVNAENRTAGSDTDNPGVVGGVTIDQGNDGEYESYADTDILDDNNQTSKGLLLTEDDMEGTAMNSSLYRRNPFARIAERSTIDQRTPYLVTIDGNTVIRIEECQYCRK